MSKVAVIIADVAIVVVGYTRRDDGECIDDAGTAALMATHSPAMTDEERAAIDAALSTALPPSRFQRR